MTNKEKMVRVAAGVGALLLAGASIPLYLSEDTETLQAEQLLAVDEEPAIEGEDVPEAAEAEPKARKKAEAKPKMSPEERRFARRDRNDDGRISLEEYLHTRRKNFDKLDTNGDGVLSFEEYAKQGINKFREADKDRSGFLNRDEFATV